MTEDHSTQTDANATGVLEINEKGFGFLRKAKNNYLAGQDDVFVPPNLIRQYKLREGLTLVGPVQMADGGRGKGRSPQLESIVTVNGESPDVYATCKPFTELTSIDPVEILALESPSNTPEARLPMRVIDLVALVGKGQRGLIVAAPK